MNNSSTIPSTSHSDNRMLDDAALFSSASVAAAVRLRFSHFLLKPYHTYATTSSTNELSTVTAQEEEEELSDEQREQRQLIDSIDEEDSESESDHPHPHPVPVPIAIPPAPVSQPLKQPHQHQHQHHSIRYSASNDEVDDDTHFPHSGLPHTPHIQLFDIALLWQRISVTAADLHQFQLRMHEVLNGSFLRCSSHLFGCTCTWDDTGDDGGNINTSFPFDSERQHSNVVLNPSASSPSTRCRLLQFIMRAHDTLLEGLICPCESIRNGTQQLLTDCGLDIPLFKVDDSGMRIHDLNIQAMKEHVAKHADACVRDIAIGRSRMKAICQSYVALCNFTYVDPAKEVDEDVFFHSTMNPTDSFDQLLSVRWQIKSHQVGTTALTKHYLELQIANLRPMQYQVMLKDGLVFIEGSTEFTVYNIETTMSKPPIDVDQDRGGDPSYLYQVFELPDELFLRACQINQQPEVHICIKFKVQELFPPALRTASMASVKSPPLQSTSFMRQMNIIHPSTTSIGAASLSSISGVRPSSLEMLPPPQAHNPRDEVAFSGTMDMTSTNQPCSINNLTVHRNYSHRQSANIHHPHQLNSSSQTQTVTQAAANFNPIPMLMSQSENTRNQPVLSQQSTLIPLQHTRCENTAPQHHMLLNLPWTQIRRPQAQEARMHNVMNDQNDD